MFAEVYPLKRLPRRFGFFDYALPDGVTSSRGTLVAIPFRNQTTWGIVKTIKQTTETPKTKAILSVSDAYALTSSELDYFEALAADLVQSVGTVLYATLPTPPKRPHAHAPPFRHTEPLTIPSRDAQILTDAVQRLENAVTMTLGARDLKQTAAVVSRYRQQHSSEAISVLCPNVRDAELLAAHLGAWNPLLLTGDESPGARFQTWKAWRDNGRLLIATRLGALWTHPNLHAVFLARAEHENHKQPDRNPRIDSRACAALLSSVLGARVAFASVSRAAFHEPIATASLVQERPVSIHPILSVSLISGLDAARAAGKPVLLAYNRKGEFRRLRCADCGAVFPPTDPLPLTCAMCHGTNLVRKGYGNRAIASALEAHYPGIRIAVLDKDAKDNGWQQAEIVIATRHYIENVFDPFHPHGWGFLADLDADAPLFEPTYEAQTRALQNMNEWRAVAEASRAPFLIQTDSPDVFRRMIDDPIGFLRADEENRRAYGFPPFTRQIRIHPVPDGMEERIRAASPDAVLVREDGALLVTTRPEAAPSLLPLFSSLDDEYIIDTSAQP